MNTCSTRSRKISRSFSRAAASYDDAAMLQHEVAARLVERLDYFTVGADKILDLGCGTGFCSVEVARRYPEAAILCLDISMSMLVQARSKGRGNHYVCSSATRLPLPDKAVDVVVSGMMLHWCEQPGEVVREVLRVLRPGGVFIFSACAAGTLCELSATWQQAGIDSPVLGFPKMEDFASFMSAAGYSEPVIDREVLRLQRQDFKSLISVLRRSGVTAQSRPAVSRTAMRNIVRAYEQYRSGGQLQASFEVVYGHGFAPAGNRVPGEVEISLERLRDKSG